MQTQLILVLSKDRIWGLQSPGRTPANGDNFISFKGSHKSSSKAWEHLFIIVLLIRIVTQKLISRTTNNKTLKLLSLTNEPSDYTVSFNRYCGNGNFDECKDLNELRGVLQKPPENTLPHICVYHPRHSSFEMYDVVVSCAREFRRMINLNIIFGILKELLIL